MDRIEKCKNVLTLIVLALILVSLALCPKYQQLIFMYYHQAIQSVKWNFRNIPDFPDRTEMEHLTLDEKLEHLSQLSRSGENIYDFL